MNEVLIKQVKQFAPTFEPMQVDNFHFENVSAQDWGDMLCLLFKEEGYVSMQDRREGMVRKICAKNISPQQFIPLQREIKKLDDRIMKYIYCSMYKWFYKKSNGKRSYAISTAQFMRENVDTDEERELLLSVFADIDMCLLLSDVLESWVVDINNNLREINEKERLDVFDGVTNAMKQLRAMSSLYKEGYSEEEKTTLFDVCDDIEAYCREKTKAYREKRKEIHRKRYHIER